MDIWFEGFPDTWTYSTAVYLDDELHNKLSAQNMELG